MIQKIFNNYITCLKSYFFGIINSYKHKKSMFLKVSIISIRLVIKLLRGIFMNIVLCDDDQLQIDLLQKYLAKWQNKNNNYCSCISFSSAIQLLLNIEDLQNTDLFILDIEMKDLNGMQLAKKLRDLNFNCQIAFITGYKEYVFEGYLVDAISYILKPLSENEFFSCLDKVVNKQQKQQATILVQTESGIQKVIVQDIVCIESQKHNLLITTKNGSLITRMTINQIEDLLNNQFFISPHRSYLVNIAYIERINKSEIQLIKELIIPIARGKWQLINKCYLDYYRGKI